MSFIFARPGYYRVVASARGEREGSVSGRHGLVAELTFATLWILVDETGGRITEGYDPSAANGRALMFGAYGPFVSTALPIRERSGRRGGPSADASVPSTLLEGYVKYYDPSLSAYTGVTGRISGTCYGRSEYAIDYDLFTNVIVYVMESGYFQAECPDGYEYFSGVHYLTGTYSDAYGKNGAQAGTTVSGYLGGSAALAYVTNDAAASAFNKAEHYAPIANSRFGQSRSSKITYWVSNDVADSTSYYWRFCYGGSCGDGMIYGNPQGAFGELGYFTVIHEYGHAFHRGALGATYSSAACGSEHYIDDESTLQCAYREGFADFFAVWIAGDQLTGTPTGIITDYRIEGNVYLLTGQNGSITEGAVAAFLYDLVDTSSDPNSANNQSGSTDDSIGYPGSYISDVIMNCSLAKSGGGTVTILDGIDQFVYCAERSLDDQSLVNSATGNPYFAERTQAYTSVSGPSNTPSGWSVSNIRAAWKYDLFKHGSLP
ncbi:MAG: hypothetical protein HYV19_04770 [Gemmatimonadetes bacterium]|nr:hypothetical protein [Gemmatimonadota bacterium]